MKRKILAILIAVVQLVSILCVTASANTSIPYTFDFSNVQTLDNGGEFSYPAIDGITYKMVTNFGGQYEGKLYSGIGGRTSDDYCYGVNSISTKTSNNAAGLNFVFLGEEELKGKKAVKIGIDVAANTIWYDNDFCGLRIRFNANGDDGTMPNSSSKSISFGQKMKMFGQEMSYLNENKNDIWISANTWYRIELIIDLENKTMDTYVNGYAVNGKMNLPVLKDMTQSITYIIVGGEYKTTAAQSSYIMYYDNLTVETCDKTNVYSSSYSDLSDKPIEKLTNDGFKVNFNHLNLSGAKNKTISGVAIYKDNELYRVLMDENTNNELPLEYKPVITVNPEDLPSDMSDVTAKSFVWKYEDFKPLMKALPISADE